MNKHTKLLEAYLFVSGGSSDKKQLSRALACTEQELKEAADELASLRAGSGVVLFDDGHTLSLRTAQDVGEAVAAQYGNEAERPLSHAAKETLAVIAYAGPIVKYDLDLLRGVNTQFMLRRLRAQGFVRETGKERLLAVTVEFLAHVGIEAVQSLPAYRETRSHIQAGLATLRERMETI